MNNRNLWNNPNTLSDDELEGLYWITDIYGGVALAWYRGYGNSAAWFDLTDQRIIEDERAIVLGWLPIQYPESGSPPNVK